jgi:hypothetical protein
MEPRQNLTSLHNAGLFSFATIAETQTQRDESVENGDFLAPNS